ncbi:CDP-alcohol phosphatidyltransferase family protein [Actinoplanes sp. N902-109]|uniref:CDP-alcohol phosphatidyltransferase family protein n=1 Tax=Actinoplanes sp. (strain N902-109) TaxID=649831 RepID=UPI0012F97CBF|nr:CDP-alcohol phosphatidyltransferase family protein [Actinoplanes sp. N902-109]
MSIGTMTARPARGPLAGLAAHLLLTVALAATAGVTAGGWLAGTVYAVGLYLALRTGMEQAGMRALGPANTVTLGRAVLVGGVTALVVTSFQRHVPLALLVTLVGVALALDGVDGQVARRTGTTTALGARFDMEIDAFLILVLSIYVAADFGWWTVAIGAFRYAFVAASWAAPWLSAALPAKFSRKVVAALQGVVLVVVTAGLLPHAAAFLALTLALGSLTWSFGRDISWLRRTEHHRRAHAAATRRTATPRRHVPHPAHT